MKVFYRLALSLCTLAVAAHVTLKTAAADEVAIERASGERLTSAIAHYARARTLLIAAIREFDQGMELANANTLLDATRFRASMINRAAELERVLDPQPRASKTGVKFNADTRLLGGSKK